ncbi:MAG: hypothetical protein GC181_08740 [Bacteroidetes bacterium]|nr:hypothetical protein [Bacteroidota bacterium]
MYRVFIFGRLKTRIINCARIVGMMLLLMLLVTCADASTPEGDFKLSTSYIPLELNTQNVKQLRYDKYGGIWILTNHKIFRFNGSELTEVKYFRNQCVDFEVSENELFILADRWFYQLNFTEGTLDSTRLPEGEFPVDLYLWNRQIWILNQSGTIYNWHEGGSLQTSGIRVKNAQLLNCEKDAIWLKSESEILKFNAYNGKVIQRLPLPDEDKQAFVSKTGLYAYGNNELKKFESGEWRTVLNIHAIRFLVNNEGVWCFVGDNSDVDELTLTGFHFVSASELSIDSTDLFYSGGNYCNVIKRNILYQFERSAVYFRWVELIDEDGSPCTNNCYQIYSPDAGSYYYVASSRGVLRVYKSNNKIERRINISPDEKRTNSFYLHPYGDTLFVYSLQGCYQIHLKTLETKTLIYPRNLVPRPDGNHDMLNCLNMSPQFIWAGNKGSNIMRYDRKTGKVKIYYLSPLQPYKYKPIVYEIAIHKTNPVLVLNQDGVNYWNTEKDTFLPAIEIFPGLQVLPTHELSSIHYVNDSTLILGSFSYGLFEYDIRTNTLKKPSLGSGSLIKISDMFLAPDGILWCCAANGLIAYNPENGETNLYNSSHGLIRDDFYYIYLSFQSKGIVNAGMFGGYYQFRPPTKSPALKLTIEAVESGNGINKNEICAVWNEHTVYLNPGENSIRLKVHPAMQTPVILGTLFYRVVRSDSGWYSSQSNNLLDLHDLPTGRNIIQLKYGETGVVAILTVVVQRHFWQMPWFKWAMILIPVLILSGFLYYRMVMIRIEKKKEVEVRNRLVYLENSLIKAQMNSHFIFNSLNSIKSFIAANEPRKATKYLNTFALLIRNILNASQDNMVTLAKELKTIQMYLELEQLRFEDGFQFDIEVDKNLDTESILIPSLIFQPYVENAIWHGILHKKDAIGRILISVERESDMLKIIVRDNGVGRVVSAQLKSKFSSFKGQGMRLTKERLELYSNEKKGSTRIEIKDLYEDENATGTEVRLWLPILTNT